MRSETLVRAHGRIAVEKRVEVTGADGSVGTLTVTGENHGAA